MAERDGIVAWLRREAAENRELGKPSRPGQVRSFEKRHIQRAQALEHAATAIENFADLKRPEPTIPASEWVKKGNLKY